MADNKSISRQTKAVIDLSALISNYQYLASLAPKSKTMAVIKANAYEHGAIEVAKALESVVPAFAVAFVDEAILLREAGIKKDILVLEGPFKRTDFAIATSHQLTLMLHTQQHIDWLVKQTQYKLATWVKVDTGMNRLGFHISEISRVISQLSDQQRQHLVLCTHFSTAEIANNEKTASQISKMNNLIDQFPCQFSMANSAGILNWPESHGHFNRLGLALYGVSPIKSCDIVKPLIPVMTLQANIIAIHSIEIGETVGYGDTWQAERPTAIAVIAIGYADGYPRNAKAGTPVYVNGKIAPLAGRVSMDMITIDITDIDNVAVGDTVELWGKHISVDTVAQYSDTINYELLTRLSARLPKAFVKS